MQSELPTALNVSDTDYPLEYNERSLMFMFFDLQQHTRNQLCK